MSGNQQISNIQAVVILVATAVFIAWFVLSARRVRRREAERARAFCEAVRPPVPPAPATSPAPFYREQRYIVLKLSDIERANLTAEERVALNAICLRVYAARRASGRPRFGAVVVEAGWPEYEPTWRTIEARVRAESARRSAA